MRSTNDESLELKFQILKFVPAIGRHGGVKMNRVICIKGHFYDGDKYETCPHCASGAEAIRQDPFSVRHSELEEEKISGRKNAGKARHEKGGFFHRGGKKEAALMSAVKPTTNTVQGTVLLQMNAEAEIPQQKSEHNPEQAPDQRASAAATGQKAIKQGTIGQGTIDQGAIEQQAQNSQESVSKSLSAAFAASAQPGETGDEGKTVGYFSAGKTDPPVGYLICTAGEDYGMGFPLKTGNNSIGRSVSMDVVIMDEKVSREKQAFVMYEPIRREFYMKPGEGTGLCYLNGELVLGPVKMKAFDLIMLGDTKLMLIPVCCEKFSWEEAK